MKNTQFCSMDWLARSGSHLDRCKAAAMALTLSWTIRNDIASCHELAYSSLALGEATRLLFFTNENETIEFGKNVVSFQSFAHLP